MNGGMGNIHSHRVEPYPVHRRASYDTRPESPAHPAIATMQQQNNSPHGSPSMHPRALAPAPGPPPPPPGAYYDPRGPPPPAQYSYAPPPPHGHYHHDASYPPPPPPHGGHPQMRPGGPDYAMTFPGSHTGLPVIHTDDAATKLSDRVRRRCFNCCTTDTSTWRRSNLSPGKVLCNKCGLFERTHSRPRPEQFPHKRGPLSSSSIKQRNSHAPPPAPPGTEYGLSGQYAAMLPGGGGQMQPIPGPPPKHHQQQQQQQHHPHSHHVQHHQPPPPPPGSTGGGQLPHLNQWIDESHHQPGAPLPPPPSSAPAPKEGGGGEKNEGVTLPRIDAIRDV
ncbi:hypothetical protein DL96DRAFT_1634833 [Flagelloscypha sp. PMI_526]|nr:hypothetical protein DL96DRAFT_1634833 [Flagelloscypha sp. PMI_526]